MAGNRRRWRRHCALLATFALATGPAFAAGEAPKGPSELLFVAQLVVLILVGSLLGEAMQRIGQPAVMGQLIAGILLGPSCFGASAAGLAAAMIFPAGRQKAMIDARVAARHPAVAAADRHGDRSQACAAASAAHRFGDFDRRNRLPFACGFTLGDLLPESLLPTPARAG